MSYIIGRPAHLSHTVVATRFKVVHLCAGWDYQRGIHTTCGEYLKSKNWWHVAGFDPDQVFGLRANVSEKRCPRCAHKWNRNNK